MPCYAPLKGYKDPHTGGLTFSRRGTLEKMDVGCGQCLYCRYAHAQMWAVRITHESTLYHENCFITLTYRDKRVANLEQLKGNFYVPDDWSLNKKHFQDFMKRLRKYFSPRKIRYYACGEYGRKCKHGIDVQQHKCPLCFVGRPHFHACLFNCSFDDLETYASDDGVLRYTSSTLQRIWKYGFVDVGELNFGSAGYVARYVLKKITGAKAFDHYLSYSMDGEVVYLEPEFTLMSGGGRSNKGKRCGIGAQWFYRYCGDVFPADEVPVPGHGIVQVVPRYYEEIYEDMYPGLLQDVKRKRQEFLRNNEEEFSAERLEVKYRVHLAKTKERRRYLG